MKEGDFIFLSASVPYRKGWIEDSLPREIEEAVISLARAVFARGGRLLFGGHPSISPLVASVAAEYFQPDATRELRPVVTYQSRLFKDILPNETWEMHRLGFSAIVWTGENETQAQSLTDMRREMIANPKADDVKRHGLRRPRAMVVVGGMEGILEETAIFLQAREKWPRLPSVYFVESGGGAAKRLGQPDNPWLERQLNEIKSDKPTIERLLTARQKNQFRRVETEWSAEFKIDFKAFPFPPYASMMQRLADQLD